VKIQEADAKSLLRAEGLPVPGWELAKTPEQVREAARKLFDEGADRVVIKAQVLVGGRGKAGGVKLAGSPQEAFEVGSRILGMDIKGITVRKVMVARAVDIVKEYYLGAIIDRSSRRIVLMASAEGGVEIEEVAKTNPGAIHRVAAHAELGLLPFQARSLGLAIGFRDSLLNQFVAIAQGLHATMKANDADLVEVNPLGIVEETGPDGKRSPRLLCLDAKITLDDSGLARHAALEAMRDLDEEDPTDAQARRLGINFIHLDGTIGCMVNGAGLAMTTNFLDVGGGARHEVVAGAMELILADPNVKAILVNIFGGITRGDEVAAGLIEAGAHASRSVPMVVRIVGTNAEEAARLLREAKMETASSLDEAAEKAVAMAKGAAQ
jgi:succinyl-CoA synthetase beta subunit